MSVMTGMGTALNLIGASNTKTRVGRLTSLGEIAPTAEAIDVTTLESGWKAYIPGCRDAGEVELKGFHDPDDAGQAALAAALGTGALLDLEAAFPDGSRALFSGFVKKYAVGAAEVDNALGFTATLRLSGEVTFEEEEDDDDDGGEE